MCEDYITEKYWKLYDSTTIFDVNIIPVVRGAREHQYKRETPNFSYINTYNFDSARSLADYLNFLDRNNTAYLQYFNWKTVLYKKIELNLNYRKKITSNWNVSIYYHLREPFCRLCSMLHNETYLSSKKNKKWMISEWYNKKSNCWDQDENRVFLYKIIKYFGFCF